MLQCYTTQVNYLQNLCEVIVGPSDLLGEPVWILDVIESV